MNVAHPIIRQIDHIMIESPRADDLFSLLTDTLALPVVWPMQEHTDFASGGVSAGNMSIEVARPQDEPGQDSAGGFGARVHGIACEPHSLAQAIAGLDERGIHHSDPDPYVITRSDGTPRTLWRWVYLPHWGDTLVYLCDYEPDISTRETRRRMLDHRDGGALGLVAVKEVAIGTTDLDGGHRYWSQLLAPAPEVSAGTWQVGEGPALRLVPHHRDTVLSVTIQVASLIRAKAALQEHGIRGDTADGEASIAQEAVQGLDVRIVES